jgi:hypothetical protein
MRDTRVKSFLFFDQSVITRKLLSLTGFIGLAASLVAIGLWTAEQLSGWLAFELLTIPFKLILLAAPLFFLSDLSAFLYWRPRVAIALGFTLVAVTLCAMLAYLPWRETFTHHFSNSSYRWYYSNMPSQYPGLYGDFGEWQKQWAQHIPHAIEAGLVFVYYSIIIAACTLWRLRRVSGAIIAIVGYLLLFLVPTFTGLIIWDYDIFLKGIAFDSISMDLFPAFFWHAGDYSIFLYAFMFIFFSVTATFTYLRPRVTVNQAL